MPDETPQHILPGCEGYELKKHRRPIRATQSMVRCPECGGTCVIVARTHWKREPGMRERLCQRCGHVWHTKEVNCS